MNKKTIITALLALVAMTGHGQTTDTIRVGMEMKLQNVISTNVFMMHRETTPMKGLPCKYAVSSFPTTFIIDPSGKYRKVQSPMLVTPLGMTILVNPLQYRKDA